MAFSVKWYWNSGTDSSPVWTEFGSGNVLKFTGGLYDTSLSINNYQSATHLQTSSSTDTDACGSPHIPNLKYISSNKAAIRGTYSSLLSATFPATTMCIKMVVSDFTTPVSFTTNNGKLFFFDGTTPTTAPTDLTTMGLEQGDTSWTNCGGSASAVSISDKTSATSQTFYVAVSVMPTNTGSLTGSLRFSLNYNTGSGNVSLSSDVDIEVASSYCDAQRSDHVINLITSTDNRPFLKEISSRSIDNSYGSSTSITYSSPRQIVGVVIPDSNYYSKTMKGFGIELKATPALLVPITCSYAIGSRVFDLTTNSWYELVGESDAIRHLENSLEDSVNYREYSLVKIQGNDI